MTPRPEDVALLRRLAKLLTGIAATAKALERSHGDVDVYEMRLPREIATSLAADAATLGSLASRLEGEGRDGVRLAEAVLDLWDSRPAVIANDAEYFAHTARQDAKREKVLELARAIAPASSPQPTTTTEEHENE